MSEYDVELMRGVSGNMSHKAALAEVKFPQHAVKLYGCVEQMSQNAIRIRLETTQVDAQVLCPGNEAQLMVVARGVTYRATVSVAENDMPRITMRFNAPPLAERRQNARRRTCDMTVSLRELRDIGCMGAWQQVQATDISANGMRVVCERRMGFVGEVELLFYLDADATYLSNAGMEGQDSDASKLAHMRMVKATARVAHTYVLPNGGQAVGLAFRKIPSFDQLRLMRYAEADPIS